MTWHRKERIAYAPRAADAIPDILLRQAARGIWEMLEGERLSLTANARELGSGTTPSDVLRSLKERH